jgi:hypothetical protein
MITFEYIQAAAYIMKFILIVTIATKTVATPKNKSNSPK